MTRFGAVAAWTGPALVMALVTGVAAGGVAAPLFVLAATAAPLLALLPGPTARAAPFALTAGVLTTACLLLAGFRVVSDVGRAAGLDAWPLVGAAAGLLVVTTAWPRRTALAGVALVAGAGALVVAVVVLGIAATTAPWTAWSRVASRAAFELGPRGPWSTDGTPPAMPVTLTFSEPHRITVTAAGVYRVIERDRSAVVVREWRLAPDASLALRPGDTLSIPAGGRVRLEAGKRVPGTTSGVRWAGRPTPSGGRVLAEWLGLSLTLTGAALAILRPVDRLSRTAALLGPLTVLAVVLATGCVALYGVDLAPELATGVAPATALAHVASTVAEEPWGSRLAGVMVGALAALFVAAAAALHQRLADLARVDGGRLGVILRDGLARTAVWTVLVAAAAAGSVWVRDGWSLFLHGAGLAAAVLLGPLLAGGEGVGAGDRGVRMAAAVAGGTVYGCVLAAARGLGPLPVDPASALARFPALVAVPAAWLVALVLHGALVRSGVLDSAGGQMVAGARRR